MGFQAEGGEDQGSGHTECGKGALGLRMGLPGQDHWEFQAPGPRSGKNRGEWGFSLPYIGQSPIAGLRSWTSINRYQWFGWPGAQHVTSYSLRFSRFPLCVAGCCSFPRPPWLRSGWTAQPWARAGSAVRFFASQVPPVDAQTPITRGTGWVVDRVRLG